MCINASDCS
jgi:hypothetical protein